MRNFMNVILVRPKTDAWFIEAGGECKTESQKK